MKRIWIACGLLTVILVATLCNSHYLTTYATSLTDLLKQAEIAAEGGDWEKAATLTKTAHERWDEKESYLHITLRHSDTDQVYTGFREVTEFIQCQEGGEYSAANAKLIAWIELLYEMEQLNLKNLL